MARYLYSELSSLIRSSKNSAHINAMDWASTHQTFADELVENYMPSGGGFDSGTGLDHDASHADKLVFHTTFHHMDEWGSYNGWTEHTVTVTPGFDRLHIRVSGRNRNDIKEMIHEQFYQCLQTDVEWDIVSKWSRAKGVEIKHEWIDDCKQRWYVTDNGIEVFTPADGAHTYTHLGQCRAFAVEFVKSKPHCNQF